MGIIEGLALVVCGALCMPSIIAKKKPEAKELLAKIAQFQGWIGIVCLGVGVWRLLSAIGWLSYLGVAPLYTITWLASAIILILGGFLLGFGMIQQFALKNASAEVKAKAEEAHQKLVGIQIPLGFVSVIAGAWVIVYTLILFPNIISI